MPELPEERVRLLQVTMPTLPILPADLFSRGTEARWDTFRNTKLEYYIHNFPEILDLKVKSSVGDYDVVGLTNWHTSSTKREIDLSEKLGADPSASYVVFDFWNQRILGAFRQKLPVKSFLTTLAFFSFTLFASILNLSVFRAISAATTRCTMLAGRFENHLAWHFGQRARRPILHLDLRPQRLLNPKRQRRLVEPADHYR